MKYLILILALCLVTFQGCIQNKIDNPKIENTDTLQNEEIYTCPMHPSVISKNPSTCPICGMALVRKSLPNNLSSKEIESLKLVSLSPTQRILANVATTKVEVKEIDYIINAFGIVVFAEPNLYTITAKYNGRVQKLYANFTGQRIQKKQVLFELYSPELIATQNELQLAQKNQQTDFLQSARNKLKYHFGLTEDQISLIEKSNEIFYSIPIQSQISGTIISKYITEGQFIEEGMNLYQVADLSKVWVMLNIYEKDLPFVEQNSKVEIIFDAYPKRKLIGTINFIDPVIDPELRTVRVRIELENIDGTLKPQMFVSGNIFLNKKRTLVVPSTSIINTGQNDYVWVEISENAFEPRHVITGIRSNNQTEILEGLKPGEIIVTTGSFLLDAESQLLYGVSSINSPRLDTIENSITDRKENEKINEVTITVDGNYFPSVIYAKKGKLVKINFVRLDNIKCTDEVVFPDFNIKKYLTPNQTTTIELIPRQAGEYRFHCGMDMLEGKLIVR